MKNLRKQFLPILTYARIDIRRLFRDKVAIFFVFAFPLIFLFVFGGLFARQSDYSFNVALINHSDSEIAANFVENAKEIDVFEVNEEVTNLDKAHESMSRGELDATIVLPEDFGAPGEDRRPRGEAQVLYDQNSEQAGTALASILEAAFEELNAQFVDTARPFTVKAESTATEGLTQFDYVFSGLLGFTLLSLGVFGPTTVFPRLKQRGILRRYHTTTLRVWQYFTGNVISNMVVGLLSVGVMFAVALTVFDLNVRGDYFNLALVVLLGTALMFGIGLAMGGWAKNENQAAPLANLVSFPMMFLSGVFFPTFLMPGWLQTVSQFIPLTPIVDAIRLILTEGKTVLDLGTQFAIMGAWTVAIYIIAFKVFRWE